MDWRYAVLCYRFVMGLCAVSLVFVKTILRILLMTAEHEPVSGNFGYYGCRRNGGRKRVSLNHSLRGNIQRRQPVAIYQGIICRLLLFTQFTARCDCRSSSVAGAP